MDRKLNYSRIRTVFLMMKFNESPIDVFSSSKRMPIIASPIFHFRMEAVQTFKTHFKPTQRLITTTTITTNITTLFLTTTRVPVTVFLPV